MVCRDQRSGELQAIRGAQGVRTEQTFGRSTYRVRRYNFVPTVSEPAGHRKCSRDFIRRHRFFSLEPRER